jgi:hypothetical protein
LRKAEEYLYKNNVFVVASFEWPEIHTGVDDQAMDSQQLITPIVTDKYAARMKQHTVRMHIAKNMEPITAGASVDRPSKILLQSVLLVANDFHAFCFSLRYRLGALHGFAVTVTDGVATRTQLNLIGVTASYQKLKPPALKIEFRDTGFRVADKDLQRDLLGPLSKITSPSLQVSLTGALRLPDDFNIRSIKLAMGPSVVSYQALARYFFDVMLKGKHLADAAVLCGEHQVAFRLYAIISDQATQWVSSVVNEGSEVATYALSGLKLDILISLAYLYVKIGDMEKLTYNCIGLKSTLEALVAAPDSTVTVTMKQAEARIRHILLLEELFAYDPSRIPGHRVQTVGEAIKLLSQSPDEAYHQHDLWILEAVEKREDPASDHLLREHCSACKLEPVLSAIYQSEDVPRKPDHIVGLQNIKTLSKLSADIKKEINEMQRKYRAQITDWDWVEGRQAGHT